MKNSLELTKDELRFTLLALADAVSTRGNLAIASATDKLRRQWALRHETHAPHWEAITLDEAKEAFSADGLTFPGDLGSVVVLVTSDPHYEADDVSLEVHFLAKDAKTDDLPLMEVLFKEEAHRLAAESMAEAGWVGPSLVRSLLSAELRQVLYNKGFHIPVNPGWMTETKLHSLSDVDDMPVYAERE